MLAIPNCRKKARLIIPDRCGNTRPAAADADKTILREIRQKRRVNADAAQYRLLKRALFCVKKAKACGIACVGVEFFGYAAPGELEAAGAVAVVSTAEELEDFILHH